jgi:hypothetical protein
MRRRYGGCRCEVSRTNLAFAKSLDSKSGPQNAMNTYKAWQILF